MVKKNLTYLLLDGSCVSTLVSISGEEPYLGVGTKYGFKLGSDRKFLRALYAFSANHLALLVELEEFAS